jgi:molybdate transport system substrate-binding protein
LREYAVFIAFTPELSMSRIFVLLLGLLLSSLTARAETFTVAAAADLKYAMAELAAEFGKSRPGSAPDVVFGSSGKLYQQIANGAPFDLFFSADISYPRLLQEAGMAASGVRPYAFGRLVLWGKSGFPGKLTMERLAADDIRHVAIANPKHAPYGMRALEVLQNLGLSAKVSPKLVFGENVAQAAQFVDTGSAEAGIIALSLALGPELGARGSYTLIPDNLHAPLEQGYVLLKRSSGNNAAKAFGEFVSSPKGRAILRAWGFVLPGEEGL